MGAPGTSYVGGSAGVGWLENAAQNAASDDDPGFMDGGPYVYSAGTSVVHRWFEPPLGAGIPTPTPATTFDFCYGCQSATAITVAAAPWTDSMPDHIGEQFGNPNGKPVDHFTLTRNGRTIADADDAFGATVAVPSGTATYRAVIDIDRSLVKTRISPSSHTEFGFTSTTGQGPALPHGAFCDAAANGTGPCTVLPILQARVSLGLSLLDTATASSLPVAVQVARAPGAAPAAATSATVQFRRAGTTIWSSAALRPVGGNQFRGSLAIPAGWSGRTVDLKVRAADAGGSTFDQTISSAFAAPIVPAPTVVDTAAAAALATTAVSTQSGSGPEAPAAGTAQAACPAAPAGHVRCFALWRAGAARDRAGAAAQRAGATPPRPSEGYGPADITAAYQLDASRGAGQTIGIVDAYGDPRVESDLAVARATWGLPACTRANQCLRWSTRRAGASSRPATRAWGVETSLDVQAVSAPARSAESCWCRPTPTP